MSTMLPKPTVTPEELSLLLLSDSATELERQPGSEQSGKQSSEQLLVMIERLQHTVDNLTARVQQLEANLNQQADASNEERNPEFSYGLAPKPASDEGQTLDLMLQPVSAPVPVAIPEPEPESESESVPEKRVQESEPIAEPAAAPVMEQLLEQEDHRDADIPEEPVMDLDFSLDEDKEHYSEERFADKPNETKAPVIPSLSSTIPDDALQLSYLSRSDLHGRKKSAFRKLFGK
jgi:hypothetical protein